MRNLFFLLSTLVLAPAVAAAQGNLGDAKVDCSLLSRKANGTWSAAAQTTFEFGGSKITIAQGDVEPRLLQYGMPDLHSVLEKACPEKKSAPAQAPKAEN
jgi:hypothetical protein